MRNECVICTEKKIAQAKCITQSSCIAFKNNIKIYLLELIHIGDTIYLYIHTLFLLFFYIQRKI